MTRGGGDSGEFNWNSMVVFLGFCFIGLPFWGIGLFIGTMKGWEFTALGFGMFFAWSFMLQKVGGMLRDEDDGRGR